MNTALASDLGEPCSPTGSPTAAEPTPPSRAWPVAILGVPFDPVTIEGALARIDAMIASRKSHYVVTANVDFLVQAHRDVELRRILVEADLVLCDGTPVLWASGWLGNRLPARVAGSDLAPALLQAAADKGHRVFFLGAAPGVAAEAAERLRRRYPKLQIVGHHAPPFAELLEMNHAGIAQRIRAAKPDLLLVSFGCPKQEKWIAMHHRSLGVPVAIGVGATLDFLAGRVRRAPAWMRGSGTEWIYRLAQEPRRLFRRYARDLVCFLPTLAEQWLRLSARRAPTPPPPPPRPDGNAGINPGPSLTHRALTTYPEFWHTVSGPRAGNVIDLSGVRAIDSTGLAFLLRWRQSLRRRGRRLVLLDPSPAVRRALAAARLLDHFTLAADPAEALRQSESPAAAPAILHDGNPRSLGWCGEIVAANTGMVWDLTTAHVSDFARAGAALVIIDLSRLGFIDSSGAALMLRLRQWARQFPVQVMFAQPQRNVRNVLRLTRLESLLLEGAQ